MVLSGRDLAKRDLHEEIIRPFLPRGTLFGLSYGLSHAGYDIRVKQSCVILPGSFLLASTVERFQIPLDLVGIVHDKSTWARRGLAVQNTVLEPGWCGYLTLELSNHGREPITIFPYSPIAQVIFHVLSSPVEGYSGKYQNQADKPVEAINEDRQGPEPWTSDPH